MARDRGDGGNAGNKLNYLSLLKRNVKEGGGEFFVARMAEYGTRSLPVPALLMVTNFVGEQFLDDVDAQKDSAKAFGVFFGQYRELAENAWIEFWEEAGKISRKARHNPDKFQELWDASKFGKKASTEEDMADKKDDKKAAKAAEAPKPEKTLLQVVGELDAPLQTQFWNTVNAILANIPAPTTPHGTSPQQAAAQHQALKDDFLARVKRVTLSKEEVTALLHATTDELRRDMLRQAVENAFNAGGLSGGFRAIMDGASNAMRGALSGITHSSPDALRQKLQATNVRRKKEDDDVSKIR